MTISFLRPVGAPADVRELEYVSALHQTEMPDLRMDGSIRDVDIVRFLSSRYGVSVTPEEVRKTVMFGLGGGDDEEESIDLMEMVAILLIPTLAKAASQKDADERETLARDSFSDEHEYNRYRRKHAIAESLLPHKGLLGYVLNMILHDVTGSSEPKELDKDLIRQIFVSYGETELARDDNLLDEMIASAKGCNCDQSGGNHRRDADSEGNNAEGTNCTCYSELERFILDDDTFVRALTSDVGLYDVDNEMRCTTTYFDVFKTHQSQHERVQPTDIEQGENGGQTSTEQREEIRLVRKVWTASSIDFAAGTYRVKTLVVSLWAAFAITYFGYYYNDFDESVDTGCVDFSESRSEAVGCRALTSILRWFFVFLSVSVMGLLFVGLGSVGNSIESEKRFKPLVGLLAVAIQVFVPFFDERISNNPDDILLYHASLILGCWAMSLHFYNFLGLSIPKSFLEKRPRLERFFMPGGTRAESHLKQAAARKMNSLTKNALDIVTIKDPDSLIRTHYGQALLTFSSSEEKVETIGGFAWTWRQIFSKELFKKEGIWIPARFLAGNIAMIIVSVFVLLSGIDLTQRAINDYGKDDVEDLFDVFFNTAIGKQSDNGNLVAKTMSSYQFFQISQGAKDYSCIDIARQNWNGTNIACRNFGGAPEYECFNSSVICTEIQHTTVPGHGYRLTSIEGVVQSAVDIAVEETLNEFYPEERYMVVTPLAVGTCIAFLASVTLTVIYIPSIVSTILKLRSGVIPTFRDKNFGKHRFGAELVTILLGSMVWGTLLSSILVGGFVGAIIFFLIWQVTEKFALRVFAFLCGITIIIIIRVLVLLVVRTKYYEAFYRPRPARANIVALALEASNFALSFGFITVRVVKLILAAAFYIGRIDTPFLAPGVGNPWGYFELDNYPTIFIKDMLAHDAHRHPYLETLGTMYMLKLRYGEHFGSRAGSCWRLIFVFALMPWLSKYRMMARPEMRHDEDDITTERSSINFISLYRNLIPLDNGVDLEEISHHKPASRAEKSSTRHSVNAPPITEAGHSPGFKSDTDDASQDYLEKETEKMPSFASASEKAAWFEERYALIELENAELKRRLRLVEMKCHRSSLLNVKV